MRSSLKPLESKARERARQDARRNVQKLSYNHISCQFMDIDSVQKLEEVPNAVATIADKAPEPNLPDSAAEVSVCTILVFPSL